MRYFGNILRRGPKALFPAAASARFPAAVPAILAAALLTACGGGRSSAGSQVPVQSSGNPVDQIIAEKAEEAAATTPGGNEAPADDAVKPVEPAAGEETSASDPWLQEDYVYESPENMSHDGIDVDLTVLSPTMVYAEVFNMISYAPDYPEDDEEIIVTGVFDTYIDVDGIEYCRLLDAVMGTDEAGKG